ncbi:MAG TPA: hypothetical protein VFD05_01435 [Bacilli bacterium]|nr:hypothetical protein [Bacilli bacterium]
MSRKKYKTSATKDKREPNIRFRRLVGSLINNKAAYEGGRYDKWWMAVILYFLSIVIAVVPIMVQTGKTKGSDIYAAPNNLFHTDVGLRKFTDALEENDVDLKIITVDGEKRFSSPDFDRVATDTFTFRIDQITNREVEIPYFSYKNNRQSEGEVVEFEYLRVYFVNEQDKIWVGDRQVLVENHFANYLAGLTESNRDNLTSHYIFGQENIYFRIYNPANMNEGADIYRYYNGVTSPLPENLNIRDFSTKDANGNPLQLNDFDYLEKYMTNWAALADLAYGPVRTQAFWVQTGLNLIIFAIVGLVMGLIIFLSTRGKTNPHRDLKFFESFKVGMWLLPTPALITLIIGFIMPNYFTLAFVMTLGLRSVWLTMRTLNPYVQDQ